MSRKYVDCRDYPSETKCSLMMAGEEEELLNAATEHAVSVHSATDTPELREYMKTRFKDLPEDWNPRVPKMSPSSAERASPGGPNEMPI